MRFHPVHGEDFSVICEDFGAEGEALEAIAHALDAGRSLVLTRARYDRAADENGVVIKPRQRGIGAIVEDRQHRDGPVPVTPVSSGRSISRGAPAQPPGPRPGTVDDGASMAAGMCRRPTYSATATLAACTPMAARRALTDLWLAAPGAVMSPRYDAPRLSSTNSASRTPRPGTSCMPSSGHRRPTASPPWPPSASTSGPATATSDSPPASNPS
jgi:hypothetical protein